jgi:hypothetical protein
MTLTSVRSATYLPGFILCALSCLLITPFIARAQSVQAPVNLGTAGNYVILSQTGITDVPPSPIVGNIGASPSRAQPSTSPVRKSPGQYHRWMRPVLPPAV